MKKEMAMSQDINMAIVLAVGQGSRLSPLTESIPKSLVRNFIAEDIVHLEGLGPFKT